jgi:hypothetical protein
MKIRYEKGNFAIIPNLDEIMGISTTEAALKVYIALCKFSDDTGGCFPAIETIREFTCLSTGGVRKGLKELRENGFVGVTKRQRKNGSATSNYYQILVVTTVQGGYTDVGGDPTRTGHPITIPIEHPTKVGDKSQSTKNKEESEIKKNFYLVVKKYQLPVLNHKHVDSWCDKLRDTLGEKTARAYLVRLQERDLREETKMEQYVPSLNRPLDILEKSAKIIAYFTRTKDKNIPTESLVEDPIVASGGIFPAKWPKGKPEWRTDYGQDNDREDKYFRGVKIDNTNQDEMQRIQSERANGGADGSK